MNKKTRKKRVQQQIQKEGWHLIGELPVDSGSMLIGDPHYVLPDKVTKRLIETIDFNARAVYGFTPIEEKFIRKIIKAKRCLNTYNHKLAAFMVNSGYGDGIYPVYVKKNDEGRVIEMKIRFDITSPAEGILEHGMTVPPLQHTNSRDQFNQMIGRDESIDKKYVKYWQEQFTHSDKAHVMSLMFENEWELIPLEKQKEIIEQPLNVLPKEITSVLIDVIKESMKANK